MILRPEPKWRIWPGAGRRETPCSGLRRGTAACRRGRSGTSRRRRSSFSGLPRRRRRCRFGVASTTDRRRCSARLAWGRRRARTAWLDWVAFCLSGARKKGETRKPWWRGRLGTVDLLVPTSLDELLFKLKILFTYVSKHAILMRGSIVPILSL